ncbi:MAG: hypothetical protein WBC85_10660 [Planktotalea sp.]|uniref:hypothetical protein n=1 Tax=Planktotalea sp. TaxID=2029877 RepID=UPI003C76D48A
MRSKTLFNTGLVMGLISAILVVAFMIYTVQSQQQIAKLLDTLQTASGNTVSSPAPTTDQQIIEARQKIAEANRRIASLKSAIAAHANNAQALFRAGQALEQVDVLITDISANSQRVADAHADLETQVIQMEALYTQKVEALREQFSISQSAAFGLPFWVGVVGIIGSFSAMVIAWRKDHRDLIQLQREMESTDPS